MGEKNEKKVRSIRNDFHNVSESEYNKFKLLRKWPNTSAPQIYRMGCFFVVKQRSFVKIVIYLTVKKSVCYTWYGKSNEPLF